MNFEDIFKTQLKKDSTYRIGTIVSSSPTIQFDGETAASQKVYKRISSYSPAKNDRVLLCKVSGTYIILGKIV